jgi:hypothetical protein
VSRIGGMSLADLQREAESMWAKGFPEKTMTKLEDFGFIQSKPKGAPRAPQRDCSVPASQPKRRLLMRGFQACMHTRAVVWRGGCVGLRRPVCALGPAGEFHSNNQTMAKLLHKAIGLGDGSKADPEAYK